MSSSDQARQDGLIATAAVLTSLSTALVLARCIVRFGLIRKGGWDDITIIVSMIFTIAYLICLLVARSNHIGFPITTLIPDNMSALLKITFAIEIIYYTIIYTIKSSIIFMYLRFAVSERFARLCQGTLVLLTVFYILCFAITIGQCQPVSKAWDITMKQPGSCINTTSFFYFTSGFNIITDLWILILPIPTLRNIHIARRERFVLYGVFGIGAFATALSCVRLQSIYTFTLATDPFHDAILVNLWSMIEVNSAIVCANIPALKPLFQPRRLLQTVRNTSGSNGKRSENGYHEVDRSRDIDIDRSHAESNGSGIIMVATEHHRQKDERLPDSDDSISLTRLPDAYLRV